MKLLPVSATHRLKSMITSSIDCYVEIFTHRVSVGSPETKTKHHPLCRDPFVFGLLACAPKFKDLLWCFCEPGM